HAGPALTAAEVDAGVYVVDQCDLAPAEQTLLQELAVLQVREQFLHLRLHLGQVVPPRVRSDVLGDQVLGDVPRQPLKRRLLGERLDDHLVAENLVGLLVEVREWVIVEEGHSQAPKTSSRSGLCRKSLGGGGAAGGSRGSLYPASRCRAARSAFSR